MNATATSKPTLPAAAFGGRYAWSANDDGTFSFLNLPIVGELAKGTRPDYPDLAITKEWLDEALASLNAGAADGYLPPLNVNHHGQEKPVERIGFVRAREVRKIRYRGAEMYALFADLERVGPEAALEIAKGNLPYCSIEGTIKGPADVKSLAMLTDKPPQFGFPIITAGLPLSAEGGEPWSLARSTYKVFAFAYEGDEGEKPAAKAEDETPEEDDEEDAETGDEGETAKGCRYCAENHVMLRKLSAVLLPSDEEKQNLDTDTGTRGPVGTEKKTEDDETKKDEESTMSTDPAAAAKLAALENDVAQFKAKDAAREAESAAVALATEAETALAKDGFALAASTKTAILKFARLGKDQLDVFVGVFKETATKDPPRDVAAALAAGQKVAPLAADDEALVAKFAGTDANAGEIGRRALRKYPAYAASAPRPMSKERWVEMAIANNKSGEFALVSADEFDKDDS